MPVAGYKTSCAILDPARAGRFALPVVNVTSVNTARMGKFSSDRSIRDYCDATWNIKPRQ